MAGVAGTEALEHRERRHGAAGVQRLDAPADGVVRLERHGELVLHEAARAVRPDRRPPSGRAAEARPAAVGERLDAQRGLLSPRPPRPGSRRTVPGEVSASRRDPEVVGDEVAQTLHRAGRPADRAARPGAVAGGGREPGVRPRPSRPPRASSPPARGRTLGAAR